MNQQSASSGFTNNPSAYSNLSSLVAPNANQPAPADPSSPKADERTSKSPVKANAAKPVNSNDRCRHYTATGRRCRLAILDPASGLCFRHAGLQFQPSDADLSPAFGGLLYQLQSACGIHDFLSQLTVLLVQNRISTRRAAILAYLGQTLLRTLPAIELELKPPEEEQQILFDLPRPKRDDDISPERAMVNRWAERCARAATPVEPDGYDGYTSIPEKSKCPEKSK